MSGWSHAAVQRAIEHEHLFAFVWSSFDHLHPGDRFVPSWHVEAICHALQRVAAGQCRRLLITVPPRHGKSICTAVGLPAWMLGRRPSLKIMVASYGSDLAGKHAGDFRQIVGAPWYQQIFPAMRLANGGNRADEQITSQGGGRKAISLGGAATGFGADLIIIDDLMKAADAASPVERQRVKDFYEQTLLSRLNDQATGRIVVIQQRLHEDDLPGYLVEKGQFEHLNLPAIAPDDAEVPIGFGQVRRRGKNEALCPERQSIADLEALRREMGPGAFSAQYQQDPTPPGGNRVRWEWFGTFVPELYDRADFERVLQSWDTGATAEPTSDYSVCVTAGYRNRCWHILDVWRGRLDYPDLLRQVKTLGQRWQADTVLIERANTGIPLFRELHFKSRGLPAYEPIVPRLDKATRVEAQTAQLETGMYRVPEGAPWVPEFRRELLAFPNGRYDDQVDSLVQLVAWINSRRGGGFDERDPVSGRVLRIERPRSVNRPVGSSR